MSAIEYMPAKSGYTTSPSKVMVTIWASATEDRVVLLAGMSSDVEPEMANALARLARVHELNPGRRSRRSRRLAKVLAGEVDSLQERRAAATRELLDD